jgi:hypothetical protein
MKQIWHIAFIDIKLMVKDKVYFLWVLAFPLIFIFIFGNIYTQDTRGPVQASLTVINRDEGKWGAYFIEKIKSPGIALQEVDKEPEEYSRILIIPADFSKKIEEKKAQELLFKKKESANAQAAAQAETRIMQAITKVITELILHPDISTFLKRKANSGTLSRSNRSSRKTPLQRHLRDTTTLYREYLSSFS